MVKYLDNNSGFKQWAAARDANAPKRRGGWIWWFVIFMAIWWATTIFIGRNNEAAQTADTFVAEDASNVATSEIASDKISATVRGLRVSDVVLADYNVAPNDEARVQLLTTPGFAEVGLLATGTSAPMANTQWRDTGDGMSWRAPDGTTYTRNVSADGYVVTITDTIKNNTSHDIAVAPYARIVRENNMMSSAGVSTGAIAYANSDLDENTWRDLDKKSYAYSTTRGFAGFTDQYWETVASIDSPDQTMRIKQGGTLDNTPIYQADIAAAAVQIAPNASANITTRLYVGPRDQDALNAASAHIAGLGDTIDYGWFWFLARPMLWALNGLNAWVGNYGVAIIILTILLRLLMWPLTRKSYQSMAAMQKMQPEMTRIQKLYGNDKARMQMEMLRLYQTHKTSPMSGCLPMLLQIPIFFALYKALLVSVPMRNAHFLWISDLSAMDPYFILPILMGATMWLQQYWQTPKTKDTAQNDAIAATQRMMKWMPVIFTVMFAWMPAGLVLYWTVSNIFGIMQMYIIKHKK